MIGYTARLAPAKLGLAVQAFVQVQMATHSPEVARSFGVLLACPEIVSAWTLTGEADYLLRVWCADLADLNRVIHQLLLPHRRWRGCKPDRDGPIQSGCAAADVRVI